MRYLSFFLSNLTNFLNSLFPFLIKIPSKSLPVQIKTMVSLPSRSGRHLQRYEEGYRLVVGQIPGRILMSFRSKLLQLVAPNSAARYSFNSAVAWGKKILDPQNWNKILLLSCLIAVALDSLFLYGLVIEVGKKCLSVDSTMEITASVLRSFTDIFYMLHIIFQFRTGRGVLVDDTWAIAKRYLSSYFLIDILSVLPFPQVVILIITLKMAGSSYLNTKNVLKFAVIFQYVPRFMRIYPLYKEVTTSGILTETAWAGAAFSLFLYMLGSHVLGANWYLFSIERQTDCWIQACGTLVTCRLEYLFCDGAGGAGNLSFLDNHCPIRTPNETVFNFGIFLDALQSGVVLSSTGFSDKFFYCFWWGMRNLRCVVFVLTSFSALSSYLTTWDISVAI